MELKNIYLNEELVLVKKLKGEKLGSIFEIISIKKSNKFKNCEIILQSRLSNEKWLVVDLDKFEKYEDLVHIKHFDGKILTKTKFNSICESKLIIQMFRIDFTTYLLKLIDGERVIIKVSN